MSRQRLQSRTGPCKICPLKKASGLAYRLPILNLPSSPAAKLRSPLTGLSAGGGERSALPERQPQSHFLPRTRVPSLPCRASARLQCPSEVGGTCQGNPTPRSPLFLLPPEGGQNCVSGLLAAFVNERCVLFRVDAEDETGACSVFDEAT